MMTEPTARTNRMSVNGKLVHRSALSDLGFGGEGAFAPGGSLLERSEGS